jgi:hypothetical protein
MRNTLVLRCSLTTKAESADVLRDLVDDSGSGATKVTTMFTENDSLCASRINHRYAHPPVVWVVPRHRR